MKNAGVLLNVFSLRRGETARSAKQFFENSLCALRVSFAALRDIFSKKRLLLPALLIFAAGI